MAVRIRLPPPGRRRLVVQDAGLSSRTTPVRIRSPVRIVRSTAGRLSLEQRTGVRFPDDPPGMVPILGSFSGRTLGSDPGNGGSIPSPRTTERTYNDLVRHPAGHPEGRMPVLRWASADALFQGRQLLLPPMPATDRRAMIAGLLRGLAVYAFIVALALPGAVGTTPLGSWSRPPHR